jgi:hypothetical protein
VVAGIALVVGSAESDEVVDVVDAVVVVVVVAAVVVVAGTAAGLGVEPWPHALTSAMHARRSVTRRATGGTYCPMRCGQVAVVFRSRN